MTRECTACDGSGQIEMDCEPEQGGFGIYSCGVCNGTGRVASPPNAIFCAYCGEEIYHDETKTEIDDEYDEDGKFVKTYTLEIKTYKHYDTDEEHCNDCKHFAYPKPKTTKKP